MLYRKLFLVTCFCSLSTLFIQAQENKNQDEFQLKEESKKQSQTIANEAAGQFNNEVIATLELECPKVNSFILRGNIPLPPNYYPNDDEPHSFGVADFSGFVNAQVEVVSRYPTGEADIIEIIALVTRDPTAVPGSQIQFPIVTFDQHNSISKNEEIDILLRAVDPKVLEILSNPKQISLKSEDVFGNTYSCYPLLINDTSEIIRSGQHMFQWKTYMQLVPDNVVEGSQETLPHLLGAHFYISIFSQGDDRRPYVQIDMSFNNGQMLDLENPAFPDKVYFKSLECLIPERWSLQPRFEDPFFGPAIQKGNEELVPIVRAHENGAMHILEPRGQFHRRFIFALDGFEDESFDFLAEEGQAFVIPGNNSNGQDFFSWWNSDTARFLPQKIKIPYLDYLGKDNLRTTYENNLNQYANSIATGQGNAGNLKTDALGFKLPWGDAYGGSTGGGSLYFEEGSQVAYAASKDGCGYYKALHRLIIDRQEISFFRPDGKTATVEDFLIETPYGPTVPFHFFHLPVSNDFWVKQFFTINKEPTIQEQAVMDQGKQPSYEAALLNYQAIDQQHLMRSIRYALALIYLTNDPLSKDHLRNEAELGFLSYHPFFNSPNGGTQSSSMRGKIIFVEDNPEKGVEHGRGQGWLGHAINAAYAMADDGWRDYMKENYYEPLVNMLENAQIPCSGVIYTAFDPDKMFENYYGRKTPEEMICTISMLGVRAQVYEGTGEPQEDALHNLLKGVFYSFIGELSWADLGDKCGVMFKNANSPADITEPAFCGPLPDDGMGNIDNSWFPSILAHGFLETLRDGNPDPLFIEKAVLISDGKTMESLKEELESTNYNSIKYGNKAALIRLMQDLNWQIPD